MFEQKLGQNKQVRAFECVRFQLLICMNIGLNAITRLLLHVANVMQHYKENWCLKLNIIRLPSNTCSTYWLRTKFPERSMRSKKTCVFFSWSSETIRVGYVIQGAPKHTPRSRTLFLFIGLGPT